MNASRESTVLILDLGATSGRGMLARCSGGAITLKEIHRFRNVPVTQNGTLCWDFDRLFSECAAAYGKAAECGISAISIDTWGVDYGLIDADGSLCRPPVHYRDRRTEGAVRKLAAKILPEELYRLTGIQLIEINTLYQLVAELERDPSSLNGKKLLFIPDLIAYMITGTVKNEYTAASTSALLDPFTRSWNLPLIRRLGIPEELFSPIDESERFYGKANAAFGGVPVVMSAGHDTASAVCGVPAKGDFAYLSCGTWSLMGTVNSEPILTDPSFTNEGGVGGTYRYLKNIMGLWLISEAKRRLALSGCDYTYAEIERLAREEKPFVSFIDPNDTAFTLPDDMPEAIRRFCRETAQPVPDSPAQLFRCIYDSLAMEYRRTFLRLEKLTGRRFRELHIVGGGVRDSLLCGITADCCGVPVVAGPVEATALGNAATAFTRLGVLDDAGDAVRRSSQTEIYAPGRFPAEAYAKYNDIIERKENR